jgi:hypothetical protein
VNDFAKGAGGRWNSPSHYNRGRELYFLYPNPCTNHINKVNKREYGPQHEVFMVCSIEEYHGNGLDDSRRATDMRGLLILISIRVVVQPR